MAGFLKKVFSFGKKEVIEKPAEDEALAPINWDALKEFKREEEPAEAPAPVEPAKIEEPAIQTAVEAEAPLRPSLREPAGDDAAEPAPRFPEPPAPDIPDDELQEPDLPTEIPDPFTPDDELRDPDVPDEAPEPELPDEMPAEPEPPARPEPEVPAPDERPDVPAPEIPDDELQEPEIPDETPSGPAPAPDVPDEAAPAPEPEVPPAPKPAPAEPAKPKPAPVEVPPSPSPEKPAPAPEKPAPEKTPIEPARPIELPTPEPPVEVPSPEPRPVPEVPIEVPEPNRGVQPAAAPAARTIPASSDDPDALGQIDWEGLKAFRRQDEPPPPEPTSKVTVAKKVEQKVTTVAPPPPAPRIPWFQRLRDGLSRSSRELSSNIAGVFTKRKLDEDTLQDLEDVLLRADLGLETAIRVTDTLAASRYGKEISDLEVRTVMAQEVEKVLTPVAQALELDLSYKPHVILVVGVNGTGKTTTIGKLAAKLKEGGLSVMLAAGDTFRAAAIEQLKIWGERTDSPVISSKLGADAAGLAFDAFVQAREVGSDVLIIDTAGRLQNKTELMAELEKIVRVLNKHDPEAPHTVLQTVDATTGQNALNQVEIFRNVAGVNGLVMTKLDGTARGGILVAIAAKHKLPVYFIGVGEQVDDLEPFSAGDFAKAIAGVV